jgi:polar amino acid transport system substrate-binding protein
MVGIKHRSGILIAIVAALALLLAACGGNNNNNSSSTTASGSGMTDLGKQLPPSIQQSKQLKVGSDVAYAPVEFFKVGTQDVQGIDWDLAQAMGKKLGVTVSFANTTFDGIIPALTAKRFDVIMSAMSDTSERQKQVDFIDYFNAGTSILVKKGNPEGIRSLDDLCGKTFAIQKGSTQVDVASVQLSKWQAAGKPKI